jgi:MGT family glycosyltransferase
VSRRYLSAIVDGGGNVPPELHVVRRLVERGHEVMVLSDDSVAHDVRATGAIWRRWRRAPNRRDRRPENDPIRDWECVAPWRLVERLVTTMFVGPADRYAHDTVDAIREFDPHLVISSMFCIGAMVAAEGSKRPFDVLIPNVYPLPAEGMPPFGLGLLPAKGRLGRARDRALAGMAEWLWDHYGLATLNAVRRDHRLAKVGHVFDQLHRARCQLILTSAGFDFKSTLPANARYVGPVLDDPVWATDAPWHPPPGDLPLVLVAMSSTYQAQGGCLQRVIDALASVSVRGIVTTGPAIDPATLRSPARVAVMRSAPHHQVLQYASAVVTHGGHGTAMKALAAGVPLVVLPHGRDQADTAARIVARGAGLTLARRARPSRIAAAVRRVLDDASFRVAAERLGGAIRHDACANELLHELEEELQPPVSAVREETTPPRE